MALAMIYPDPEKGGRGKKANSSETKGFSAARLSQARSVLRHSRALAEDVLANRISLDAALAEVHDNERAAASIDEQMAELRAIEVYAQQAKNTEAERQACEIRLRAERKWGQLRDTEVLPQGRPEKTSDDTRISRRSLDDMGVSYDQSSQWQKLAAIPDDEFEAALSGPDKPTTNGHRRGGGKRMGRTTAATS